MSEEDTNTSNDLPEMPSMPSMSIEDQIYFLEVALKNPPNEEIRVKTQEKLDELLNIQQDNT
jgi:hypothetical protein